MSSETLPDDLAVDDREVMVEAVNLGKLYAIFNRPEDRLKQMMFGRLTGRKWYREHWALREVNFTIRRGEAIGIIGRNGAGKSTLLQLITGIMAPTTGSVRIHGRVAALLELGAGFNPEFTGRENVYLAASLLGLTTAEIDARYKDIEDFADIGMFIEQPVKFYSSGMYARLAFAVAAHVDADVLIVDEILSVGDVSFNQKCMRFIKKFKERGTLLFVTHDTAAVANLCDRALWIEQGQLREAGDAKTVSEHYLASVFGSRVSRRKTADDGDAGVRKGRRRYVDVRDAAFRSYLPARQIEFFSFDEERAFGERAAVITDVRIENLEGEELVLAEGGEDVRIVIEADVHQPVERPFVGFLVRDRLGQNLFGDNTFLTFATEDRRAGPGDRLRGAFQFEMPHLPPGDYAITVAVSDGAQDDHAHLHWIHDAVYFRVNASRIGGVLFGVPIEAMELSVESGDEPAGGSGRNKRGELTNG